MSIRKVLLVPGEFYHLYNRGNSKQKIFHGTEDYARFMGLLYACSKEENNISKFMQKISTAYVMYYNKKYERTGGLFEGKFKSQHLNTDRYLKYIFSYIYLNPVKLIDSKWKDRGIQNKQKALKFLKKYTYSSYLDYLGINRLQNKILDTKAFPKYFPDKRSFLNEIFDWLNYKDFR